MSKLKEYKRCPVCGFNIQAFGCKAKVSKSHFGNYYYSVIICERGQRMYYESKEGSKKKCTRKLKNMVKLIKEGRV